MSLKGLRNHTSRNGFDLSNKNCFTAKAGELLPVMVKEVLPGDKFKISPQWFTRTMPANSAAYTRVREYYDFFFVPNRLLWRFFPNFVTQMDNNQSAAAANVLSSSASSNNDLGKFQPYLTSDGIREVIDMAAGTEDIFGNDAAYGMKKLCSYLGYPYDPEKDTTNVGLNPFPLLAYQKIYYDYYRFSQWEKSDPSIFNVDYILGTTSSNASLDSLFYDMVGAFSSDNPFSLRYCNWNKDYFMGLMPSPQFGDTASITISTSSEIGRALSLSVSDLSLLAPRVNSNATSDGTLYTTYSGAGNSSLSVLTSDTTNRVTMLGGSSATMNLSVSALKNLRAALGVSDVAGALSMLALRQAQALQKWKEVSLSGNEDYKTQIEKHFGVKVPAGLSGLCEFIGGCSADLSFGEVVNTNLSDNTEGSAYIQGKGVSSGRGRFSFEAKEHGILMCIYHCLPLLDYTINGIHPINLKTAATDYAIPEFDRIGMQEVRASNLSADLSVSALLGYAPRYVDYKTDIDQIHGDFTSSLAYWVAPLTSDYLKSVISTNTAISSEVAVNYVFFKCNPSVLDPLFKTAAYDESGEYQEDQFLINSYFDVKAVRNLDYDGLPY